MAEKYDNLIQRVNIANFRCIDLIVRF